MRPRALLVLLLLLAALVPPGVAQSPSAITASDDGSGGGAAYRFDATRYVVAPGATVVVRDAGQEPHTVTATDKSFDVTVQPGGNATFVAPTTPGEHKFYCKFHAGPSTEPGQGMAAVLVVQNASATPAPGASPTAKTPGFGPGLLGLAGLAALILARRRA